jgi:hypothetical protein
MTARMARGVVARVTGPRGIDPSHSAIRSTIL